MAEYRKKTGSDTWHWCRNCHLDPKSDYTSTTERPRSDLCNHCKGKEDNKNCNTT